MFQDKAQTAENGWQSVELGMIYCGKTEFGHLGASLRASWEAVVRGAAALHLLARTGPLPARRALRSTTSQLAEPAVITLKEH
jgi:hypothetical protein